MSRSTLTEVVILQRDYSTEADVGVAHVGDNEVGPTVAFLEKGQRPHCRVGALLSYSPSTKALLWWAYARTTLCEFKGEPFLIHIRRRDFTVSQRLNLTLSSREHGGWIYTIPLEKFKVRQHSPYTSIWNLLVVITTFVLCSRFLLEGPENLSKAIAIIPIIAMAHPRANEPLF